MSLHVKANPQARELRVGFAITTWALSCALFLFLGSALFGIGGLVVASALWLVLVGATLGMFLVSVPEVTGLLTVNVLTGKFATYSVGLHFRFPWEQVKQENFLKISITSRSHAENYTASDGPLMEVKWNYEYQPDLSLLERHRTLDEKTINDGIRNVVSELISGEISQLPSEEARSKIAEIRKHVEEKFDGEERRRLEERYGIDFLRLTIADIDFEQRAQKARLSQYVGSKLREIAAQIHAEHPGISEKDAYNAALIVNGNVQKSVWEIEGLSEIASGLADTIRTLADAHGNRIIKP